MDRKSKFILFGISLLILVPVIGLFFMLVISANAIDMTKLIPVKNAFFDIFSLFIFSPLLMIFFIQYLSVKLA